MKLVVKIMRLALVGYYNSEKVFHSTSIRRSHNHTYEHMTSLTTVCTVEYNYNKI